MFKRLSLFAAVLAGALALAADPVRTFPWSSGSVKNLDRDWLYLESAEAVPPAGDDGYAKVGLPHSWNATDAFEKSSYRRDASWYRRHLQLTDQELKAGRLYLRFDAAGQKAKVLVNGKPLLEHAGGYAAFTGELTPLLKAGDNVVDVQVSNAHDKNLAPQSADFNFYGGLYRSVWLLSGPEAGFSRLQKSGPGVRVWSEQVSEAKADVNASLVFDNAVKTPVEAMLVCELRDRSDGTVVSKHSQPVTLAPGAGQAVKVVMPAVEKPRLWSPDDPALYDFTARLVANGQELDMVSVVHGFRFYQFTADQGFFLNGKSCFLKGVNRHQDGWKLGNAVPPEHHLRDLKLIKEVGANWLRLAHYQQDEYVLQLCDELGIMVWEEIPYVNSTTHTPEFEANLLSQMGELVEQHFNHPAILIWGMGNEVGMKDRGDGKSDNYDLLQHLNAFVHQDDPSRKTGFVIGNADYASRLQAMSIPDVIGYNLYCGWYGGKFEDFAPRITKLHAMNPDKPFVVTEFGAGSATHIHSENPQRFDFSEEYQVAFLESHLRQMATLPWLCGVNWWCFNDFGVVSRNDSVPHVNDKGLVTFGRERKDAFYVLKSRWSTSPVLRILSTNWTSRLGDPKKTYRVATNLPQVEFFHNGKSLGVQRSQDGFAWPVTLVPGKNELKAVGLRQPGAGEAQTISVDYDPKALEFGVSVEGKGKGSGGGRPSYLLDGRPETAWACREGEALLLDLRRNRLVDGLRLDWVAPFAGTVEVSASADKKGWTKAWSGPAKEFPERFPKQLQAQYLRISLKPEAKQPPAALKEIQPVLGTEKQEKSLYEKVGAGQAGP